MTKENKEKDDTEFLLGWVDKGSVLAKQEKHKEAIACFDTAIKIDPEDSQVFFCKGNSLKKLGREEEAQQCITRAKELEK
ncbi:MAG TPA: tetratricopeptide repeat protein [Nitrosopumilus sp.]|nr:tetratricopeptide repeat protein [Nitrosopumilus sp.]